LNKTFFLHSLYRSSSTYFFNEFRKIGGYTCYQEPENEFLINLDKNPEALHNLSNNTAESLRHPTLGAPYFDEFYKIKSKLVGKYKESFAFKDYFGSGLKIPRDQYEYFRLLIDNADGVPLLQLCKSLGRLKQFTQSFQGLHVSLSRNPHDQWWSNKVSAYTFDPAYLLIANADNCPESIRSVKIKYNIPFINLENVNQAFDVARKNYLDPASSYALFYSIWLHSQISMRKHSDIIVNIDRLNKKKYASEIILDLNNRGFKSPNFSNFINYPNKNNKIFDINIYNCEKYINNIFSEISPEDSNLIGDIFDEIRQEEGLIKNANLIAEVQKQDQNSIDLMSNLSSVSSLLRVHEKEIGSLSKKLSIERVKKSELNRLNSIEQRLSEELSQKEGELQGYKSELDRLNSIEQRLSEELSQKDGELQGYKSELDRLNSIEQRLSEELSQKEGELQGYKSELDRLNALERQLSKMLNELGAINIELVARNDSLKYRFELEIKNFIEILEDIKK
jgi:hypothetical protein